MTPINEEIYKHQYVDVERYGHSAYTDLETGFLTFAYLKGALIAVDICYLDKVSLISYLHSRPNRAVNTVLMLLDHMPVPENVDASK